MKNEYLVLSTVFEGAMPNFFALMHRIEVQYPNGWKGSGGRILSISYEKHPYWYSDSKEPYFQSGKTWAIFTVSDITDRDKFRPGSSIWDHSDLDEQIEILPVRKSKILATEVNPGKTQLDFYDGGLRDGNSFTRPIGDDFLEFAKMISKELHEIAAIKKQESGHYAHSYEKRREIVEAFRKARKQGEVGDKDAWARSRYNISGRTLLNYEKEFPEEM